MREHYEAQLTTLNTEMIQMGALCEDAISGAIQALLEDDKHLAEKVGSIEMEIDQHERDIERLCMRLLLMQQPVATDLRVVSSALKMISDLERIGDQAFDISDITKHVSFQKYESKVHIKEMANAVIHMVTDSVDSYVKKDAALAKKVAAADDQVDDLFLKVRSELVELVRSNQDMAEGALDLMMIAKYLERIGDHAVNVAEWVIYAITGDHMKLALGVLPLKGGGVLVESFAWCVRCHGSTPQSSLRLPAQHKARPAGALSGEPIYQKGA